MYLEGILKEIKPYSEFQYWFSRNSQDDFCILERDTNNIIGVLHEPTLDVVYEEEYAAKDKQLEDICNDFESFKRSRPEYQVGNDICISSGKDAIVMYEILLTGCIFIKARNKGVDPDNEVKSLKSCIDWLTSTGFYESPASTQYHESFPRGLLYHTLQVYRQICKLHECEVFSKISYESAAIVALMHDWCKIGLYELYNRNVKNEKTGKWEQKPAYRYNMKGIPLGHGVTSMYIASRFVRLTLEESVAIRWHMSSCNVAPNELNDLQEANERYPLVHLLQFADQLSITSYVSKIVEPEHVEG